jgi:ketosteroid isomerase-like protein
MMSERTAEAIVREYWWRMQANTFAAAAELMADTFVAEWPQSQERIRGRENYARINAEYPAHGVWVFTVHRVVATASEVVTDVSFTDGVQWARAVSFFTVSDGAITQLVEYWPDNYPAPADRAHLVERMEDR